MNKTKKRICSIPYYREDQYNRLRELSIDKENFSISYEQMNAIRESKHKEMVNKGFKVVKIDVDIEELIEWCNFRSTTLNPESRTRFALAKLKEMISNKEIDI